MIIGILKSEASNLSALVPSIAKKYIKDGHQLIMEPGIGDQSFYQDDEFKSEGVNTASVDEILSKSEIILTDTVIFPEQVSRTRSGALIIGRFNPLVNKEMIRALPVNGRMIFSLDQVPRSSIAQSMDVLSSLASLSGYKAIIIAAERYSGYFPMMSTAAGTVPPAKVLVLGAGVAGLQAIATAKRLGAMVEAFDVRSAVKEEVQSLGAKFIEVSGSQEDKEAGGYAVQQSEEYIKLQKELIHERSINADIVITTANIPGKTAPLLVEKKTVEQMKPGSIIVDLASASGGNCEVTVDEKEIHHKGIKVIGNSRLYESAPKEASRLYSTNLYNFIKFLVKDGPDQLPVKHEIVQKTLVNQN